MSKPGGGSGLFEAWLQERINAATGAQKGEPISGETIRKKMKDDLVGTWGELQNWVTRKNESNEIKNFCGDITGTWPASNGLVVGGVKEVCKAVAEIRYFMSGVETKGGTYLHQADGQADITPLTPAQAYARCIVGAVALSTIYGDHCYLGEIMQQISTEVEDKLKGTHESKGAQPDACAGITGTHLMLGKSILAGTIKEWERTTEDALRASNWKDAPWRLMKAWKNWPPKCSRERREQESKQHLKANASRMTDFMKLDTTPPGSTSAVSIEDILADPGDKYTVTEEKLTKAFETAIVNAGTGGSMDPVDLTKAIVDNLKKESEERVAEVCIKDKSSSGEEKTMCERLTCMKHLWENSTTAGAAGQGGSNNNFWDETNGSVKELWTDLSTAMNTNGTQDNADCNQNANGTDASPSEKAACKFLHAGLNYLYTGTTPAQPVSSPTGDVLKDNPSFRQTMGCFLLHAYAKHMKEKATCLIDDGIKKAFDTAGKGTKIAVPCKWEEYKDKWEDCLQKVNISSTSSTAENAKKKVDDILQKDPKIGDMAKKINKVDKLCDQVKCVVNRWLEEKKTGSSDLDRVRSKFTSQITKLEEGIISYKGDSTVSGLCNMQDKEGKEACLLIAAGLKNLYNIPANGNGNDAVTASLERTMRCVLLNAIADKLEDQNFPCKDEKNVKNGIDKAFEKSINEKIKEASTGCNGNDKCFTCPRFAISADCKVKTNDKGELQLKKEIDPKLNDTGLSSKSSFLRTSSLIKTICKPCTEKTFCGNLTCVANKWKENKGQTGTASWDDVKNDFGAALESLLDGMKKPENQTAVATEYCTTDKDYFPWEANAAGEANRTACELVAAGLKHISSIEHEYSAQNNSSPQKNKNPFDNQEFQQLVSCFMLKRVVQEMKEKSTICDISKGIEAGSDAWRSIKGKCTRQPCIECNLEKVNYEGCKIGSDNANVKDELNKILTTDKATEVKTALKDITETKGNKGPSLCDRLQCLASRVKLSGNEDTFWKDDVKKLWEELAEKIKATKGKGNGNGECDKMENATHSEKTACNYLHAGLNELYNGTTTSVKGKILDNALLKQTVGCLLLHSYAKHMKEKATCLIDEGISQAFSLWQDLSKKAPSCNGSAGAKGQCVPCQWDENDKWESCLERIIINSNTTPKENAKTKVEDIFKDDNPNMKDMLTDINKMTTLCDGLKCIASHFNSSDAQKNKSNVENFWEKDVKNLWQELAEQMKVNGGKSGSGNGCDTMDDNNGKTRIPTTPEKRACNYLHAGFEKLKGITTNDISKYPILSKHTSLKEAMGCFLLKEYAKHMKDKSKCVINSGLKKAFNSWKPTGDGKCTGDSPCIECKWDDNLDTCTITTDITPDNITGKLKTLESEMENEATTAMKDINKTESLCEKLQCAAPKWFQKHKQVNGNSATTKTWCEFWDKAVKEELTKMFQQISQNGTTNATNNNGACEAFGDNNPDSVERKACNHIAAGLQHIKNNAKSGNDQLFERTVGCIALNMYADKIIEKSKDKCPIDETTINKMFTKWNEKNNNNSSPSTPCNGANNNGCFKCNRISNSEFSSCELSVDSSLMNPTQNGSCNDNTNRKNVQTEMNKFLLEDNKPPQFIPEVKKTLTTITDMNNSFCTQLQCAAKKWNSKNGQNGKTPSWTNIEGDAKDALKQLLEQMTKGQTKSNVGEFCKESNWNTLGHKEKQTNRAACLLFAAGLKHIYGRGSGHTLGHVNGPTFEQTMGCLFLKEYAKQLQKMAEEQKKYKVHPNCSVDSGIDYAFNQSNAIMNDTPPCNKNGPNSCFECKLKEDYDGCFIGTDEVQDKVKPLFKDDQNKEHMEKTLENTVCPILLTDLLTPFLPLAPVSIGLSAMAYYLWKYFGPLGKGGPRFRRSPTEIPGSSVQEQVLGHVDEGAAHEYRLVKERKPRSAPTRTKRSGRDPGGSGRVNRRTIIEIHFEVLDECQKGDTQLNQKDFLELLVQEFMGSELMEEEQVLKEDVLMERVPMESIPMELVPSLGSGFMV
ncbi:SICAvar, type I [Plasmodium knowlesi strain H]|uniref:SICAvar, type I n=1 Tax=Plasmodium knowlesi (strain H) TaxID=5851 RepID=A0A679KY14_PLAKH|nr:SICAvar, type I [Plasmodium knowlesi strain H]CAA9988053.1 SICAvar, type I [Plasmodium knowlesi strain H]VVS77527.1 SICAvar, type I [Plasmodium knowlesi strain H]